MQLVILHNIIDDLVFGWCWVVGGCCPGIFQICWKETLEEIRVFRNCAGATGRMFIQCG